MLPLFADPVTLDPASDYSVNVIVGRWGEWRPYVKDGKLMLDTRTIADRGDAWRVTVQYMFKGKNLELNQYITGGGLKVEHEYTTQDIPTLGLPDIRCIRLSFFERSAESRGGGYRFVGSELFDMRDLNASGN